MFAAQERDALAAAETKLCEENAKAHEALAEAQRMIKEAHAREARPPDTMTVLRYFDDLAQNLAALPQAQLDALVQYLPIDTAALATEQGRRGRRRLSLIHI